MRRFSGSYSLCNRNFVIQNLRSQRISSKRLSAVCILKNLLLRGKPSLMSKFLQEKYGSIHKNHETYKKPFYLAAKSDLAWDNVIRGDAANDNYPAKTFLYELIDRDLPDFGFIKYLIVPEIEINEITQAHGDDSKRFVRQCVDFYLPQAYLVIEIDGQQHKQEGSRIADKIRDQHLQSYMCKTVRIDTTDLKERNQNYKAKIDEIRTILEHAKPLKEYRKSFETEFDDISETDKKEKLLPTACIRFQILILEMIENGYISLEDDRWEIEVKNHDVNGYEENAIFDIFEWLNHIFKLQRIPFNPPKVNAQDVANFTTGKHIKIDFSLLQRWTDTPSRYPDIIFVRTDYSGLYYDKIEQKRNAIEYFQLSTSDPYEYSFPIGNDAEYVTSLRFLLKNIFDYDDFNPGQARIIITALQRQDTIGLLPTGGGKSLCYQMACLLQPCISFVVCPIKSLMYDQVMELKGASIEHVAFITGDIEGAKRDHILHQFGIGSYFCIFISPERFQKQEFREQLQAIHNKHSLAYAVIDEVHCLSEWGHDFRTSYLNLAKTIKTHCPDSTFLGLTATASVNVLQDIQLEFGILQHNVKTLPDYTRDELEFVVIKDNGNKYAKLLNIVDSENTKHDILNLKNTSPRAGLIFTPFVNGTYGCYGLSVNLSNKLKTQVEYYAGSKPNALQCTNDEFEIYKQKVQREYKRNKFPLLVATKAFGMGVNKKNISFTVHYGIPSSMESLYQEAGRAGRDKKSACCYILLSEEKHQSLLNKLDDADVTQEQLSQTMEEVGRDGTDVHRQLFLYIKNQNTIAEDLELLTALHKTYSAPDSENLVYAAELDSEKAHVEKAIYRLSILGIIEDWTVEDFYYGVFKVTYAPYSEESVRNVLLGFIKKYESDFDFDDHPNRSKYTRIFNDDKLTPFQRYAKILLQWSYDKFSANRRRSLHNVYEQCRSFEDSSEGRSKFKQTLESYFKFTSCTYILQHIADNNNKDIDKWDRVFLDEKDKKFIADDKLVDLRGNLLRFLESYHSNTGLNLIYGLTKLALNEELSQADLVLFKSAIETIQSYDHGDHDRAMDTVYLVLKSLGGEPRKGMRSIMRILYQYCASDDEVYAMSKEYKDAPIFLQQLNKRILATNNQLANELR